MNELVGPLDGLVVVDATWGMPGAVATMLLGDYGARVVKIERPGGGLSTGSVTRASLDRGKWSVEADLDTAAGQDLLRHLLRSADVFVESFGPARAGKLQLRHEDLAPQFPLLVQCSLSGYGQTGPWSDRPGYDALIAARMGLMAEQAGHREGPIFLGHPSVSYGAAFLAVIGTLSALHARRETNRGQQIDVSLLDSVLAQSPMNWWWNERDISYLARSGTEQGFGNTRLVTDLFLCADDEYLMIHTGGDGDFKKTADLLGVGENVQTISGQREILAPLNDEERHVARALIPEIFKSKSRDHWIDLFQANDIAVQPVLRPGQALEDPQIRYAGIVTELPHDLHGPLRQAGPTIKFERCPLAAPTRAPRVGEHNQQVQSLLTGSPARADVGEPRSGGAESLHGIRVLDFSAFFATSYGAKILSDLGADVIKVEPPQGDPQRGLIDPFEACNRGKRAVVLDLKTQHGREVAHDLVRSADVVMHNMRPGKAEKVGLGYEELSALNPALIYCYLPGFGSAGPRSHQKSFAPLISGLTGLLYQGAGQGNRPVRRVMGNEDYNNGFVGAIAVLLALRYRDETGLGQYVENPQLHSNLLATTEQCIDAEGRLVADHRLDRAQVGFSPLYRLYQTQDGWICVAVLGDRSFGRLSAALSLPELTGREAFATHDAREKNGAELAGILEQRFAALASQEAFDLLDAAGVPCEIAAPDPMIPQYLWDEWAFETGRVLEHHHPTYGWIREIGMYTHLSDVALVRKTRGPLLGEHTSEILAELGHGDLPG